MKFILSIGKDWRSDGEKWIKTSCGWERIRQLESILDHINTEYLAINMFKLTFILVFEI